MKVVVFIAVTLSTILPAAAQTPYAYTIYCAARRIEVDWKNLEQMKTARGLNVCVYGPSFSSESSARSLADKQFHGIGASCSCGS